MSLLLAKPSLYFTVVMLLITSLTTPVAVKAATHAQISQLSNRLINQVLKAEPGDVVEITTSPQNLELAEDLWVDLHKVGAWSIIRMHTDRMDRLFFQNVPAKFDSEPPANDLGLIRFITAQINIDYESDPSIYDNVSPSRFAANSKNNAAITKYMLAHKLPYIEVGNGLYPSRYTAQQYGISAAQLADLFWSGVNADSSAIHQAGQAIRSMLGSGSLVHITAPNGTDVSFRAAASTVVVNDGTISAAAREKGGAAINVALPAGDVNFIPEARTANGTVVFGPQYNNSTRIVGLTLHLNAGNLTSWTAASGSDVVKKYYDSSGAGRDDFSFADIGANPDLHYIANSSLFASMAGGMVTLGVGNNVSIGGSNGSAFNLGGYIPNATVTIAGKTIIRNGVLDRLLARG